MPEHEFDAVFEQRLERLLRDFAEQAVRPFDAVEIARAAASHGVRVAVPRRGMPAWVRPVLMLALLATMLVAVGVAGGFIRLPINELNPNPTFVPFSPLPVSPEPTDGSVLSPEPGTFPPGTFPPGSLPPTFVPGTLPPTSIPTVIAPTNGPPLTPAPTLVPVTLPPTLSPEPTDTSPPSPTAEPSPSPTLLPVTVAAVAGGDLHTCAVASDGRVFCWGDNEEGALGDGTRVNRFTADVPVVGLDDALTVASGIRFSCAIRGDRSVWCWGEDPGSDASFSVPQRVPELNDATALSAGGAFACALRAGGSVACWGNGQAGQLGNGVFENNSGVPVPQAVVGIDNAVAITAGWGHGCALLQDRTIRCWGANGDGATAYGSLGDGTSETRRSTPVQVVGIDDAIAVAAGGWSTCAIRVDRSVWCWGHGERGTLGDGNATNSSTPVAVTGMTDARTLAVGRWHACVSRGDDSVWCWGDIDWGGGGGDKTTPVEGRRSLNTAALSTDRNLLVLDRDRVLWQWGFGSTNVPEEMPVGP